LLTFDDGYDDNYYEALPVLEKYKTQALFYIATGNLDSNREFWWDEVERIVLLTETISKTVSVSVKGREFSFTDDRTSRINFYSTILPLLRNISADKRDALIQQLAEQAGNKTPRTSHRSLSFEEMKKLFTSVSAVAGAHTHRHPSLAALTPAEQEREISTSKKILEEQLGKSINHFSFPFGTVNDFTAETVTICHNLGFASVAANIPNLVNGDTSPFCFPRFLVRDWKAEEFNANVQTFFRS